MAASTSVGTGNFSEPRHATTDIAGLWILFVLSSPITGQTLWIFGLLYLPLPEKLPLKPRVYFRVYPTLELASPRQVTDVPPVWDVLLPLA